MKRGGSNGGAAATTALLLALLVLVAASLHTDAAAAAAARRLGAADVPAVHEVLSSEAQPNNCTSGKTNPGSGCDRPPGQQAAEQSLAAAPGGGVLSGPKPNPCTHDPNDPTGTKCLTPPSTP